jgi:hypothetical protein
MDPIIYPYLSGLAGLALGFLVGRLWPIHLEIRWVYLFLILSTLAAMMGIRHFYLRVAPDPAEYDFKLLYGTTCSVLAFSAIYAITFWLTVFFRER